LIVRKTIAEVSTKLKRSNYPEYQNLHLYIYFLLNINLINEFSVGDILISNNITYGAMSGKLFIPLFVAQSYARQYNISTNRASAFNV